MKEKIFNRVGGALLLLLLFCGISGATMYVDFKPGGVLTAVNKEQICYYWNGDPSTAKDGGRTLSNDKLFNIDQNVVGKPTLSYPDSNYTFWSGLAPYQNSIDINIRLWNTSFNTVGGYYTDLKPFNNDPTKAPPILTFDLAYKYMKADTGIPVITQYVESTTYNYESDTTSGTVTFSSRQPENNDKMTVEISQSNWTVDGTEKGWQAGSSLTLDLASLSSGAHTLSVKHKNPWDNISSSSADVSYTVGAGGGFGGKVTITWQLTKLTGSTGINTFAIPFVTNEVSSPIIDTINNASLDANSDGTITVGELINDLNTQIGAQAVQVFGWFDSAQQKHVGLTSVIYTGGNIDTGVNGSKFTGAADAGSVLALPIIKNQPYQVTINKSGPYTLKGTVK